jgi:hypothetical protein
MPPVLTIPVISNYSFQSCASAELGPLCLTNKLYLNREKTSSSDYMFSKFKK